MLLIYILLLNVLLQLLFFAKLVLCASVFYSDNFMQNGWQFLRALKILKQI
jgi:hypothetical protein